MQDSVAIADEATNRQSQSSRYGWLIGVVISAILVTPCFWHHRLEAGDLGSHIYNAWLAQLVEQGKAPGLSIVTQWSNVFFDFVVSGLAHLAGLSTAARIASATAVLIFFWGAFSFVCAATEWVPWLLTPLLAMVSYGWTFNAGLSNYYISIGLAFFVLAIIYRGWNRYWLALLLLVPLMYLAHPLGICWAFAGAVYLLIARKIPRALHVVLFAAALCAIVAARFYLHARAVIRPASHSIIFYNGLDQLFFMNRYGILVLLLWCLIIGAFALQFFREDRLRAIGFVLIPLELYVLVEVGVQLLPNSILLAHSTAQFSELSDRLTSISAVLLCCLLACVKPPRWIWAGTAVVAATFFVFLYHDTGVIDRMEQQTEILVHQSPAESRFIQTIDPPLKYRFSVRHILDLACINYCFDYGNYEPATKQFRIRAAPENPLVVTDPRDSLAIDAETYVVPSNALPLSELCQCGPPWTKLCVRTLSSGEPLRPEIRPK